MTCRASLSRNIQNVVTAQPLDPESGDFMYVLFLAVNKDREFIKKQNSVLPKGVFGVF
jgi:hypothetical protein